MFIKVFNGKHKKLAKEANNNCFLYCYYIALIIFDKERDFDLVYSRGCEAFKFIDKELGEEEREPLDFEVSSLVSWLKSDGYIYSLIACKEKSFYHFFLNNTGRGLSIFSIRHLLKKYKKSKLIAKDKNQTQPLHESSRKTNKKIRKLIAGHRKAKVREEAVNRYGNIKLPRMDLALLSTAFTVLILASSLYYNNQLFTSLNLPIEGILTPSDYIYSSFNFIFYLILSLSLSAITILWMLKDAVTKEINEETFGLTYKNKDKEANLVAIAMIFINASALSLIFHDLEKAQSALDSILPLNAILVLIYFLKNAPFHFFEKPRRAYILCLTLVLFIFGTYSKTKSETEKIINESNTPNFEVKRKSNGKYYDLIKSTEKYVIIKNKDQSFMLIPNTDITEIKNKR